jgi:hypothetical protein
VLACAQSRVYTSLSGRQVKWVPTTGRVRSCGEPTAHLLAGEPKLCKSLGATPTRYLRFAKLLFAATFRFARAAETVKHRHALDDCNCAGGVVGVGPGWAHRRRFDPLASGHRRHCICDPVAAGPGTLRLIASNGTNCTNGNNAMQGAGGAHLSTGQPVPSAGLLPLMQLL